MPTIIVVAVLILIAVWWWMSAGSSPVAIPSSGTSGPTLDLVNKLKSITIDTAFFNDQQFLDLEAAPKTSIEGLSPGRSNPFTAGKR